MNFRHVVATGLALAMAGMLAACSGASRADCEALLTPARLDSLRDSGLTLDESWTGDDDAYAPVYSAVIEAGGASCRWGSGDDAVTYAAATMTPDQVDAAVDALEDLGFSPAGSGDSTYYIAPGGDAAIFVVTDDSLSGIAGDAHLDDLVEP